MPVLFKEFLQNGSFISVWQITETVDELLKMIKLTFEEEKILLTYNHENRKKQWLSYRMLFQELVSEKYIISYNGFGKPFLKNQEKYKHISITHSGEYSAIIINDQLSVGIDIERSAKRIERVAERFLSDKENSFIEAQNKWNHLTVCWTAKEAIFKIHGNLCFDFKTDIFIEPFTYSDNGDLNCIIQIDGKQMDYKVYYRRLNNYFLAYVTG